MLPFLGRDLLLADDLDGIALPLVYDVCPGCSALQPEVIAAELVPLVHFA